VQRELEHTRKLEQFVPGPILPFRRGQWPRVEKVVQVRDLAEFLEFYGDHDICCVVDVRLLVRVNRLVMAFRVLLEIATDRPSSFFRLFCSYDKIQQ